ncbi:hypothetical protein GR255_26545, partial [Mycobacterium tuberculosis]|nr:hypothetical protein [Mycobacterium tuberculosis]
KKVTQVQSQGEFSLRGDILEDDSPMVEFLVSSQEKIFSRVEALRFLRDESQRGILVCNVAASRVFLPNPQVFDDSILELQVGQECEQRELKNHLISLGYKKVTQVQSQGEFSLRGDILEDDSPMVEFLVSS